MTKAQFEAPEQFQQKSELYTLLPFRFARIPNIPGQILITSDTGEYLFLSEIDLHRLVDKQLKPTDELYRTLRSRHFLADGFADGYTKYAQAQFRTRKSFLFEGPGLHLFVVSLRCDHSCVYCQVSRQSPDKRQFDMSDTHASKAIDLVFASPRTSLTIEFQGGEPLLAFDTIKLIVLEVEKRNRSVGKKIDFIIASTLHLLGDEMLAFCKDHGISLSTSLDGPEWLHNANRPKRTRDSYRRTIDGITAARLALGIDRVAALTTLTKQSLAHPEEIIDEYVRQNFHSIFLRPLSPYGFAVKSQRNIGYPVQEFIDFYVRALAHLIKINRTGYHLDEAYTKLLLQNILTPYPSGYVDLRSPAGAGLGCLLYNYDGAVYASDESRMLAEMGDQRFRLGTVNDSYDKLMASPAMGLVLEGAINDTLPGCSDCAFAPYCGADPVFHAGRQGDPIGHRPSSEFCMKHTGLFNILFEKLHRAEPKEMSVLLSWLTGNNSLHNNPDTMVA